MTQKNFPSNLITHVELAHKKPKIKNVQIFTVVYVQITLLWRYFTLEITLGSSGQFCSFFFLTQIISIIMCCQF